MLGCDCSGMPNSVFCRKCVLPQPSVTITVTSCPGYTVPSVKYYCSRSGVTVPANFERPFVTTHSKIAGTTYRQTPANQH